MRRKYNVAFRPMSEYPAKLRRNNGYIIIPVGFIMLIERNPESEWVKDGSLPVRQENFIGHEPAGIRTSGCDCCTTEYQLTGFSGWFATEYAPRPREYAKVREYYIGAAEED